MVQPGGLTSQKDNLQAKDPITGFSKDLLVAISKDLVLANQTPPARKAQQKRKGAKTVKKMEQAPTSYTQSPEDATNFRALSARANYLSQDRPDIGFSTKELCREFAVPTRNSYARLKRVCRYLIGKPRMVYKCGWGKGTTDEDAMDTFVDTDFAGCKDCLLYTSDAADE